MEERDFRTKVLDLAEKGISILDDYFDGKKTGSDMIPLAARAISEGVKVWSRNELTTQVKCSQALRLISFIPVDQRPEYIGMTNPEAKRFLIPRTKNKNDHKAI